ncbi:hypothetical protein RCXUPER_183 [Rhodobacter phage RcXuper]|nr:hypothetical protein RCXUPER_183 [Rhodobacter phage RcXuper]
MKQAHNENGVELPEFTEAVAPILDPLNAGIVALMDAGYSAADIQYSLFGNIQLILSRENFHRTMSRRKAARESASS